MASVGRAEVEAEAVSHTDRVAEPIPEVEVGRSSWICTLIPSLKSFLIPGSPPYCSGPPPYGAAPPKGCYRILVVALHIRPGRIHLEADMVALPAGTAIQISYQVEASMTWIHTVVASGI